MAQMSSSRPYLVRALYEWILENDCTPYVLVNAQYPQTSVPEAFVEAGQIVLNLSPNAIRHLESPSMAASAVWPSRYGYPPRLSWRSTPARTGREWYSRLSLRQCRHRTSPTPVPPQAPLRRNRTRAGDLH